jgi:diguanylate cyclase (GGDEF)-like protein
MDPRPLVFIRLFYVLIVLQFGMAAFGWFQYRSYQRMEAGVRQQHGPVVSHHQRLQEVQSEIRIAQLAESSVSDPNLIHWREVSRRLDTALTDLSLAKLPGADGDSDAAAGQAKAFHNFAAGGGDFPAFQQALHQADLGAHQWSDRSQSTESGFEDLAAKTRRTALQVESILTLAPFLRVLALLCIGLMLKRYMLHLVGNRQQLEDELRHERGMLAERVEIRTAELQSEVAERMRVEQLNRGRNQILEMLTREQPAQDIFQALVDTVARDRSSWCCALHLVEGGALRLEASSDLPSKLTAKLQQLAMDMTDAPEAVALRERKVQAFADLSNERKPWPQFLHAYGIQSLWSTPIIAPDGTPLGTITIYSRLLAQPVQHDWELLESHSQMAAMVIERYRLQEELRRHAFHDSLTGLPNRLLGEKQLAAAISRGQRAESKVAVLWIDLDKFKQTNDVHGHVAGDAVLQEIATRLSRRFREGDTVARVGGDEFMAVLEGIPGREPVERIAAELVSELGSPIPFHGLALSVAASIGVAFFPEDGDCADLLQRNADLAMYEAKFGQHGVRSYSPALDRALSERRELEKAMSHALKHGGFVLHYQPLYEPQGPLSGFEALLRFPHPVLGMVPPSRLIPIAEESQMIVALGSWVLREACRQNRLWELGGSAIPVAVNISAMQFAREDFAEEVAQVLAETGLSPELLELELTESVMVKDFGESHRQLQKLKRLGVRIAVDDFGTGYSSLNNLHRLPIDMLKIDRSFTQALGELNGTLPIVEGIISMAHSMGMLVVAEGVETHEQMDTLSLKGCDYLQGYLFSQPVDAEKAALLLANGSHDQPVTSLAPVGALATMSMTGNASFAA